MIFMLVSCVIIGVVIPRQQRAQRESEAIKAIEGLPWSGKITDAFEICYDFQAPGQQSLSALSQQQSTIVDTNASNPTPKWLRSVVGERTFSYVAGVRLDTVAHLPTQQAKGELVEMLSAFRQLKLLHLRIGSGCPDNFETIGELEHLRNLQFDAGFKLKSLEGIEHLRQLRSLRLRNVGISSAELISLLPNLQHLELSWALKLESLGFLSKLENLKSLNIGYFSGINIFDFKQMYNNKQLTALRLRGFDGFANTHLLDELHKLETLSFVTCLVCQKALSQEVLDKVASFRSFHQVGGT